MGVLYSRKEDLFCNTIKLLIQERKEVFFMNIIELEPYLSPILEPYLSPIEDKISEILLKDIIKQEILHTLLPTTT